MSETSQDRGAVAGSAPTGSRTTQGSPTTDPPAEGCAPQTAGPRVDRATGGGAASSLHREITRALADLRSARRAAVSCAGLGMATATGMTHDVELAEWRLNRLLERRRSTAHG
jgi:hypothetical protein